MVISHVCELLSYSFRYQTWQKYTCIKGEEKATRSDAIGENLIKSVHGFYKDNATNIALKRANGKQILNETTLKLYKKYNLKAKHTMSLSKFRKLRPHHVFTVNHHRFRTCLCEVCLNMSYKAKVIHQLGIEEIKDKYDLVNASLCDKKDNPYYLPICIKRQCKDCSIYKVKDLIAGLNFEEQKLVKWKRWETVTNKNNVKRKAEIVKEQSIDAFLEETLNELKHFASHLHVAAWQHEQQKLLSTNLPPGWVTTIQDFAENYRHVSQDEIASAYFAYSQSSLLTTVSTYHCPKCPQKIEESTVFITDDLVHDANVVKCAVELQVKDWQKQGLSFGKQVFFSDGCSSQFKSKIPFSLMEEGAERAYFGSQHGKSACDSLGGIVKRAATQHVATGSGTISSSEDLYDFCQKNLQITAKCGASTHKQRRFFFINKDDVKRPELQDLATLAGTREIHQIIRMEDGLVKTRSLACYCASCLTNEGACMNDMYTGSWKEHNLYKKKSKESSPKSPRKPKIYNDVREDTGVDDNEPKKRKMNPDQVKNAETKKQKKTERKNEAEGLKENITNHGKFQNTRKTQRYYTKMMANLVKCSSQNIVSSAKAIPFEDIVAPPLSIITCNATIDAKARKLMPDIPTNVWPAKSKTLYPISVSGDGNCLPRCGSVAAYLKETNHAEIRLRIAVELIIHKSLYLDADYLSAGLPANQRLTPAQIAQFSNQYVCQRLSKSSIDAIFTQEIHEILHLGSFMGLWQVFALASILQRPIFSAYPNLGNPNVRRDMHRLIQPRVMKFKEPVLLMWTSCREDMNKSHWVPNHFVLMMPTTCPQ